MKKFVFRYEAILNIRQEKEDQIKQELADLYVTLERQEQLIEQIRGRSRKFSSVVERSLLPGGERYPLPAIAPGHQFYRDQIAACVQRLDDIREEIRLKQIELSAAMKDRKVLETLKENRKRDYIDAVNKFDEQAIEEIVNFNNAKGERNG